MRTIAIIAACMILVLACMRYGAAQESPADSAAGAETSSSSTDELHFVSVRTLDGKVDVIDPDNQLITIRRAKGGVITFQIRDPKELKGLRRGEPVVVKYIEGGKISPQGDSKAAIVRSLNNGIVGASTRTGLVGVVGHLDASNQEITIKGIDGSLETIVVADPDVLGHINKGDEIAVTHPEALALSITKAER